MLAVAEENQPKILIVEDEVIIAADLKARLEEMGYFVCGQAGTSAQALALVQETGPDLVLMDIVLKSGPNGIETAKIIRERTGVPVIFITAFFDDKLLAQAKQVGPSGYLLKPFRDPELKITVEMALHAGQVEAARRRAEEKLKQSEEKFRLLYERAPLGYHSLDESGVLVEVNRSWLEMMGYSREEALGRDFESFLDPDWRGLFEERFKRLKTRGETHETEFRLIRKDGTPILASIVGRTGGGGQGRPGQTHCLVRDITAQRQSEEALKESQERLAEVTARLPGLVYQYVQHPDGSFSIPYISGRVKEFTPFSAEELMAEPTLLYKAIHPDDVEMVKKALERSAAKMATHPMEYRVLDREGRVRWARAEAEPRQLPNGDILWNGVAIEITERKKAEGALRRSQRLFALFMDHVPALAYINQDDGRILYANRLLSELLGRGPGEVAGRFLDQVLTRDLAARFKEQNRLVMERGPQNFEDELDLGGHRGRWLTYKFPIEGDGPSPLIGGVSFDVSEVRRNEELRNRLEAQLRQAQKMEAIGTLAGGIAHDFNNILAAIIGYSELSLVGLPEDHQARWNLEQVLKASQRARDLVRQILSFSRQSEQELQPVEIGPVVKEALKLLRATLPATIEIRRKILPTEGQVMADPIQIHQMVMNLCTNAAQAMEDKGGILKVGLRELELDPESAPLEHPDLTPGRYQVLTIRDTGQGMDPQTLERIFEPFFTTKRRGRGTGLGLSVVHGIVKACEGAIAVESEPGQGSLFRVYLPLLEREEEQKEPEVPEDLVPLGTERVLFVDDEEAIADLGRRILEYLGYQATVVTSAMKALQVFEADPDWFDLVITDQTMPGMTGSEMIQQMLKIRPNLPVILCTGYSAVINPEKARALGIKRFLMKPLDIAEMARAIRLSLAGD